jgi:branched-chain amino acid transport system permease protein
MSTTLLVVQTLNGLQLGVLLFLIAAGLTLVFGVMDFINLAHGVQYMLGAYLAVTFYAVTGNFLAALVLALAAALLCGLLLEFVVFRHLYGRDHLDHVIATFGIILFINHGVKLVWGAAPLSLPIPELFSDSVRLADGLLYPVWRLVIIASGLAVGALLYVLVAHTRIGMLVRAGATNAAMVSALGVDIRRLFLIVFGFGAMLAGFAGIMIAPILSVDPGMGDTILILAFVVIVIGGIGSIRGAFLAALLIGLVDTLGRSFSVDILRLVMGPSPARTVGPAIASMLIYLLMAVVLYIRPSGLFPAKGVEVPPTLSLAVSPVPQSATRRGLDILPIGIFLVFAALPVAAPFAGGEHLLSLGSRVMIFAIAAVALDLLIGYGALISFGHAAFIGLGAYAVGILAAHGIGDALVSLPVALAVSALYAFLTGLVCLRTKGVYFIMITLAFGQMAFFTASSLAPYGGDDGLTIAARSTLAGLPLLKNERAFYYVVLLCLLATYLFCRVLVASRFGRVLRGAKENPVRMAAMGFDVYRFQLATYVIAGMIGGLSGFLLANASEFVSPAYMSWQRSGELIVMVLLGGLGSLNGAIIGTAAYLLTEEWLSGFTEHWKVIFGPVLVLVVLFARGGLIGVATEVRRFGRG